MKNNSKQNQPNTTVQQTASVTVPVTAPVTAPSDIQVTPPTSLTLIPMSTNPDGSVKQVTVDANNIATHPFFYGTICVKCFFLTR